MRAGKALHPQTPLCLPLVPPGEIREDVGPQALVAPPLLSAHCILGCLWTLSACEAEAEGIYFRLHSTQQATSSLSSILPQAQARTSPTEPLQGPCAPAPATMVTW